MIFKISARFSDSSKESLVCHRLLEVMHWRRSRIAPKLSLRWQMYLFYEKDDNFKPLQCTRSSVPDIVDCMRKVDAFELLRSLSFQKLLLYAELRSQIFSDNGRSR